MRNIRFKTIVLSVFSMLVLGGFILADSAKSNNGSYYSGDAISYNDKVVIGSVNMDYVEVFELKDGKITKAFSINGKLPLKKYFDLAFQKEGVKLYLYLVDGRYIYKYDISNIYQPVFVEKVKDNSWDWFYGIERVGNNLATIGLHEIKIWSSDLKIINAYKKIENSNQYNINFSDNGKYIFNIKEDSIEVYDNYKREKTDNIIPNFNEKHYRKLFFDTAWSDLYFVDREALKKYDINPVTSELSFSSQFKHTSDHGYDVDGIQGSQYIYFSDGIGVVKIDKTNMKPVDWLYTNGIGGKFNWSQGLNVVRSNGEEIIIGFNLNGIVALDSDLELIDFYGETEIKNQTKDELFLNLNKVSVLPGGVITLNGGGFETNEMLKIEYLDKKIELKSDNNGRFKTELEIPAVEPVYTSIKVNGQNSGLTYSISLNIK